MQRLRSNRICNHCNHISTGHVFANLSLMETKLRQEKPPEERNRVPTLSAQHVLDSFPNGFILNVTQEEFNRAVDKFLQENGVAREADYGYNEPNTLPDHGRYERFVNRVLPNPSPLVRIKGETIERLNRDPEEDNPHLSFQDELRKKIRVSPLLIEMKLRKGFETLAPGEVLGQDIEFTGKTHSAMCTGFKTLPERFEIMNSYGSGWCDDGFGDILSDDIICAWHFEVEEV